jgi:hypothetical protein
MSRRLLTVAGALALSAALAGCGKVGQLDRPGPMFGHGGTAAATTAKPGADPNRPIETVDPRDRQRETTTLTPSPSDNPSTATTPPQ